MAMASQEGLITRAIKEDATQADTVRGSQAYLPVRAPAGLPIGGILLHLGKLREQDIADVLKLQARERQPFGETAVNHKLVAAADVQHALSIQFGYPFVHPDADYFRKDLRAAYEPFSDHVDAIRSLRSELLARWLDSQNKTIAIVSPGRHEGRSYLAANLAVVFAHTGRRTLLIDADFRFPSQHKIFKTQNSTGLSSLLARRFTAENILTGVPVFSSLRLLVAGPAAPNPVDLLDAPVFSVALSKLKQRFDVILIDTPCSLYAEAANIASNADRILMVMRKHRTPLGAAKEVTARLKNGMRGKFVGCVLSSF